MTDVPGLLEGIQQGDFKALSRAISIVENELEGHEELLQSLHPAKEVPLIGLTGPPGAGKSTLVSSLIKFLLKDNKKVGVIAVDPTSPFNYGALLGDRIRMNEHFNHPNVFIRSLASRGSLGGLSEKIIEVTDVMRASNLDYILLETVGVGQAEVDIAGLADTTVVVLVPEGGDAVQTMKAGLMEIADIFVVNKADRPGADVFVKNLTNLVMAKNKTGWQVPVIKTEATTGMGVEELIGKIKAHEASPDHQDKKMHLLVQKAWSLLRAIRMKDIDPDHLKQLVENEMKKKGGSIYKLIEKYS